MSPYRYPLTSAISVGSFSEMVSILKRAIQLPCLDYFLPMPICTSRPGAWEHSSATDWSIARTRGSLSSQACVTLIWKAILAYSTTATRALSSSEGYSDSPKDWTSPTQSVGSIQSSERGERSGSGKLFPCTRKGTSVDLTPIRVQHMKYIARGERW